LVAIEETVVSSLDLVLPLHQVAYPRAGHELLPFEHGAQQQADDYEDDGDLDEREAGVSLHLPSGRGLHAVCHLPTRRVGAPRAAMLRVFRPPEGQCRGDGGFFRARGAK
jgi:hypothetical protein